MLVVFGGLPATGKTSIAAAVAEATGAAYVEIDAVEAALLRAGLDPGQGSLGSAAAVVAQAVVGGLLATGSTVVVDAVQPSGSAHADWLALAATHAAGLLVVEVTCSDPRLHRELDLARRAARSVVPAGETITDPEAEPRYAADLVLDNVGPAPTLSRQVKRVVNAMLAATAGLPG